MRCVGLVDGSETDQAKGTQMYCIHPDWWGESGRWGTSGAEKEQLTELHTKTVLPLFWDSVQIEIAHEGTFNKRENS